MIQISFDKVIPSRNELEYCSKMKKVRIKEWWQSKTEERLENRNVKFEALIIRLNLYFKTERIRDYDNYTASLGVKGIIDGIVSCGIIPNDDAAHISYSVSFKHDKEDPRTEVLLYGKKEGSEFYK